MSGFYTGKAVAVCGGGGFLGSHVVAELLHQGANVRVIQRSWPNERLAAYMDDLEVISADLVDPTQCRTALEGMEIVFNTAAQVGGIQYNIIHPGLTFHANVILGLNVLEAARLAGVARLVLTSSACVYPLEAPVPTPEEFGLIGEPEEGNLGWGWAKRTEELGARLYAQEYGMATAILRPTNLYGPRDHFDPAISHPIAALIRRTMEADSVLEVWGSGAQTRSFLHVEDCARALLAAGEQYATADPVNIGTKEEIAIRDLVHLIIEATGHKVEPSFDQSAPEGLPRKSLDISKSNRVLDWQPLYSLNDGLKATVEWYASHCV